MAEAPSRGTPRLGLGGAMEGVFALGLAMAFVRHDLGRRPGLTLNDPIWVWLIRVGGSALSAIALAGGIGLAIEMLRGRSPGSWGWGRWTWSLSSGALVLEIGVKVCLSFLGSGINHLRIAGTFILGAFQEILLHDSWLLMAFAMTAGIRQLSADQAGRDAREWSGRLFAFVLFATTLAFQVILVLGWKW